jgi:cell division protein FtsL
MRTFVVFVACLTVLAVGRVALSFAVVQKTLQTDAIVHEERRVSDKNAELREEVARLASAVRIRHIAESDLGLVDAKHVLYPKPLLRGTVSEVAATR